MNILFHHLSPYKLLSWKCDVSRLEMHNTTIKNWMQYAVSHVANTAVLLHVPKMASEARLKAYNLLGEHAPRPPGPY